MSEISVSELLNSLTKLLAAKLDSARIDVEVIMAYAMSWQRHQLYAQGDYKLVQAEQDCIAGLINRRLQGEPVAYIVGQQEFWSMSFAVNAATLIPRPETEHLVEAALSKIPLKTPWQILDLGTGSGVIALSIAKERPACFVIAVDSSQAALNVAKSNQQALGVENVDFINSCWFEKLGNEMFDVIVSNPPYIAENDLHLKLGDVAFEPRSALGSGIEGLDDLQKIISDAVRHLKAHGWLLLEHGYQQAAAVRALLSSHDYQDIITIKDYSGHERVTLARR